MQLPPGWPLAPGGAAHGYTCIVVGKKCAGRDANRDQTQNAHAGSRTRVTREACMIPLHYMRLARGKVVVWLAENGLSWGSRPPHRRYSMYFPGLNTVNGN